MSVTLLPRVDAPIVRRHRPRLRLADATAAFVNRLSRPREPYTATIEGLPLRLAPQQVLLAVAPELPDAVAIVLSVDESEGFMLRLPAAILDRIARAVQADLGSLPPAPTGPFLLELALAPLLDAAERVTGRRVRIETVERSAPQPGTMTLLLDAAIAGEPFPAQLDLGPPPALGVLPARLDGLASLVESLPARPAPVTALSASLAFVAGHTRLTLRQLASLGVGDAVLPDRWHPSRGETLVALGEALAATATTDRHKSTLKTPLRPAAEVPAAASGEAGMAQETTAAKGASKGAGNGAAKGAGQEAGETGLDALSVTLTFELGRRTLGLGELKGIGAGHVFDLGLDPEQPVDLVANGARIGHGEIVEIGERIGVRVVRLFGRD